MNGKEIRFLRTEMGMTQSELGKLLHRDKQTVARWEKSRMNIDPAQDMLVRKHVAEKLGLEMDKSIEELSQERTATIRNNQIKIKHSNCSEGHKYTVAA